MRKKKSSQQLSDENRHGQRHAHSTAKPFCKIEMSTGLARRHAGKAHAVKKMGGWETIVDKSLDIHRVTCE
jgi:hypothetical protein